MADLASLQKAAASELRISRLPIFLQTKGSVWPTTRLPIAAFSAYAFGIWLLSKLGCAPNFGRGASSLSSILSMIVGLMIAYRSNSSSDRWHEGRRIWASLTTSLRTLLTHIHLGLSPERVVNESSAQQQAAVNALMSLCIAYAYAFKHHLRDTDSLEDPAFCSLLPQTLLQSFEATPQVQRTLSGVKDMDDAEKFDRVINQDIDTLSKSPKRAGATKRGGPRNMPLFILRQIQTVLNGFHTTPAASRGSPGGSTSMLEAPTWATCLGVLREMTEQLSQAERIRDTPIPMALGIHVGQMLVLYCLSIPPQLVDLLGLWVVPVSAVVAWTFYGVDSAAAQLSDPFGTDPNDLPVDRFVRSIHMEYLELIGNGVVSGSSANDVQLSLPAGLGRPKGE